VAVNIDYLTILVKYFHCSSQTIGIMISVSTLKENHLINWSFRAKRTPTGMQAAGQCRSNCRAQDPGKSAQRVERPEGGPQGERSESSSCLFSICYWIPACAGMTQYELIRPSLIYGFW